MTNQLITYRLPIDYSLISLMSSISYVWTIVLYPYGKQTAGILNTLYGMTFQCYGNTTEFIVRSQTCQWE